MNIQQVIHRLTAIAEEITKNTEGGINGFECPVEFQHQIRKGRPRKWKVAHRPILRIGYDPEGYDDTPVYLSDIPIPAANKPEDIAAEREAGRERARALLRGETIFGNTTLTEDPE